jgi:hypothetical protein
LVIERPDLAIPDFVRAAVGQPGIVAILLAVPAILVALGLALGYRAKRRHSPGKAWL